MGIPTLFKEGVPAGWGVEYFKLKNDIMVQIGDTIVSFDLFQEYFCCNFTHCKGACCVEGDAGAPVLMEEVEKLEEALEVIEDEMTPEAKCSPGYF